MSPPLLLLLTLLSTSSPDQRPAQEPDGSSWAAAVEHGAGASTIAEGQWELRLGLGIQHTTAELEADFAPPLIPAGVFSLSYGITDRLQWSAPLPVFSYRFGERGDFEWIPWGGLNGIGVGIAGERGVALLYGLGAGLASRMHVTDGVSTVLTWSVGTRGDFAERGIGLPFTWRGSVGAGASLVVVEGFTLHLGVALGTDFLVDGQLRPGRPVVAVGSVQDVSLRRLPLVQMEMGPSWTFDVYTSIAVGLRDGEISDEYVLGCTFLF